MHLIYKDILPAYIYMALNIANIPDNKEECVRYDMVWENKGIVLGIVHHLMDKFEASDTNSKNKDLNVIIKDRRIRHIIRHLFPNINVSNSEKKTLTNYNISIKNVEPGDLMINNLNNIDKINSDKVILLPYYHPDNPCIMYEYDQNKSLDMKVMRKKVNKFTKCDRGKEHCVKDNFITIRCDSKTWDPCFEHKVLRKYFKAYYTFKDIIKLYDYISTKIMDDMCLLPEKVRVPVHIPYEVPVEVPVHVGVPYKVEVEVPVKDEEAEKKTQDIIRNLRHNISVLRVDGTNDELYNNLIIALNNKIDALNRVAETKFQ
jgi:hypothetical protein